MAPFVVRHTVPFSMLAGFLLFSLAPATALACDTGSDTAAPAAKSKKR
jgi:hypothetical protein